MPAPAADVGLPDGPTGSSRLLRLRLLFRPLECLDQWASAYGDPFCVGRGTDHPEVYFSHPQAIQDIAMADPALFEPPRGDRTLRFLLGDHALRYLSGEPHQRGRRLLIGPLHGEQMLAQGRSIQAIARDVVGRWRVGQPVRVRVAMQEVTLRVISKVVFGREEDRRLASLHGTLGSLLEDVTKAWTQLRLTRTPAWLPRAINPWTHVERQRQAIDDFILDEIRARREARAPGERDMLGVLVAARDVRGEELSEQEIRDEVWMLLFAGHETTASALTWVLYCIHRWPDVLEVLGRELETLDEQAGPEAIAGLPYLAAVCQETLRLYPGAVGVPKLLRDPLAVMGRRFEPGTQLVPCAYLTHRRAEIYPEPTSFRPERFLQRQFSPYEFLPFGAGYRRCIGMQFAQYEMKLVLATILKRWVLTLPESGSMKPVRRGVFAGPPPKLLLVPRTTVPS
ncbi:MAG: cytochrome P450 [Vicinamibacterales bacterium]